jgi:hypothetical protein
MLWPNALLTQPATATLRIANADGSGVTRIISFNPGFYPLGLTWGLGGDQRVFSIANQVFSGGVYRA